VGPGSIKPADSLDRNSGGEWKLTRVYETSSNLGQRVVGFEFDTVGAKLFGDLTRAHVNEPMADHARRQG
jgi:preprotein translocase subunit SecD